MKAARQFFRNLSTANLSVDALREKGLPYWRERVYTYTLATIAILGLFALLPSLLWSFSTGFYFLGIFDILAYLYVLALLFIRRFSYKFRASQLILLALLVGLVVFYFTGDDVGGVFWLFMVPPLASLLFGLRWGAIFLTLNIAIIGFTGYLVSIESPLIPGLIAITPESWIVFSIKFLVTNTLLTIPLGALLEGLFHGAKREQKIVEDYRLLFENNPLPMWVYDTETLNFLAVNDAAIDHYGYSRDEFLNMTIKDIRPSEQAVRLEDSISSTDRLTRHSAGNWNHVKKDGRLIEVETFSHDIEFVNRPVRLVLSNDVTEQQKAEHAVRESEDLYRELAENSQTLICTHAQDGKILSINEAAMRLTGYSKERLLQMNLWDLIVPERRNLLKVYLNRIKRRGKARGVMEILTASGERRIWEYNNTLATEGLAEPIVRGMALDVTERKNTEAKLRLSDQILQRVRTLVVVTTADGTTVYASPSSQEILGYSSEETLGDGWWKLTRPNPEDAKREIERLRKVIVGEIPLPAEPYERKIRARNGELRWIEWQDAFGPNQTIIGVGREVTERKQAEQQIQRRLAELEAIRKVSAALRATETLDQMLPQLLDITLEILDSKVGSIWLYDKGKNELKMAVARGYGDNPITPEKRGQALASSVFGTGETYVAKEYRTDMRLPEQIRQLIPEGIGGVAVPIRTGETVIGAFIVNTQMPREINEGEVNLLTTFAEIAGSAIQRSRLNQQTLHRLQTLVALGEIDRMILSSFDLQGNLKTLLRNVVDQLGVDAANVMLFDPVLQTLESKASVGFLTDAFAGSQIKLGKGYAGRAALERKTLHISNLGEDQDNSSLAKALVGESFHSYYGVPLIAKGAIRGVLELFHRSPIETDDEWLGLLNSLARRAAIAIDTVNSFESLQKSNAELTYSYDSTIEGWSRALDLRDKETKGYSRRVTQLAVELAEKFGLRGRELVDLRRGALLHDIGKMGIPDSILLKPDKLTDEEWKQMRQHPVYAREMLEPIQYLDRAIDIPYSHHEKWDGSGYPQSLKGEEIPFAACIFAVVDVYDALTSDRPYRKAWTKVKALKYIREQSGKHFDPKVVEAFLKLDLP